MTIYSTLLRLGYTDEEIRKTAEGRSETRTVTLALADTPDGDPLVGISYGGDFRAEEEYGIGDLKKALIGDSPYSWEMSRPKPSLFRSKAASIHVAHFEDVPGSLILSTRDLGTDTFKWGHNIGTSDWPLERGSKDAKDERWSGHYDEWWSSQLPHTQGVASEYKLSWLKMPELRQKAKDLGLTKLPTKKADLVTYIRTSDAFLEKAENPNDWPGWFHYGRVFIARADKGIVKDVLQLLFEAGRDSHLGMGGGSMVFGSGMSFYDARDVGPKLRKERDEHTEWLIEMEYALEPAKAAMKARGHGYYFLGSPSTGFKSKVNATGDGHEETNPEDVYYWLNGYTYDLGDGRRHQSSGYYTVQELIDGKYIEDSKIKLTKRGY